MATKKTAKKSKKTVKKKTTAKKTVKKPAAKTKKVKKAGKATKVKKTAKKPAAKKKAAAKKPVKKTTTAKPASASKEKKGHPDMRRHPRVHLKQTVSVADEKALALAEVVDVTLGGISVNSEVRIAKGARFFVVFPGAGNINENEVEAEVLRCQEIQTDSPFKYHVGAKFISANEKYIRDAIVLTKGK